LEDPVVLLYYANCNGRNYMTVGCSKNSTLQRNLISSVSRRHLLGKDLLSRALERITIPFVLSPIIIWCSSTTISAQLRQ
jgi:hypothetical protein